MFIYKMARKYRRKPSLAKKVNYLTKMVSKGKPELKHYDVDYNGAITTVQVNKLLCDPIQGTGSSNRIGDDIRSVSYYGVFYFNMEAASSVTTQSIRLIHYLANKPNETTMENNAGLDLVYNELPASNSYIVKEDKLITLSKQGPSIRKVILKGKFKYPIRQKWKQDGQRYDWHPRLVMMSDIPDIASNADRPVVEGQIRYYFTDA